MKTFKPVLLMGQIFLLISLACSTFLPAPPTATQTPVPPTLTATSLPATSTATVVPSPTATPTPVKIPSRIAYVTFLPRAGVFIHTIDPGGQNDVELTGKDCVGAMPTWSTDGMLIAYYCYSDNKSDLWIMNEDGSEAHFVAKLPGLLPFKWSPDDKYLLYHSRQPNGKENDIYILEVATGKVTNLTKDSPVWDAFPDWSPDGNHIVFTSDRTPDGKGRSLDDIWTMHADGTDLVNLTNNGEDWADYQPIWSPDGKTIAFFRSANPFSDKTVESGGPPGLWVMDVDGKNQRLVSAVETYGESYAAVWSPDGKYLAYAAGLIAQEQVVWVVPAAGGDPVKVGDMPGQKGYISWSPDSTALIFMNDDSEKDTLTIYVALADGSDTHKLLPEGRYGYGNWGP